MISSAKEQLAPTDANLRLSALTTEERKRLELMAHRYSSYLGIDEDDLINEAFVRIMSTRVWPVDVDTLAYIAQVMRSVAGDAYRARLKSRLTLVPSHGDQIDIEQVASASPPQDRVLAGRQRVGQVLELFGDDPVAQTIAEAIMIGMEGEELCQLADIDTTQLATVRRRIDRRLRAAFPEGMDS